MICFGQTQPTSGAWGLNVRLLNSARFSARLEIAVADELDVALSDQGLEPRADEDVGDAGALGGDFSGAEMADGP